MSKHLHCNTITIEITREDHGELVDGFLDTLWANRPSMTLQELINILGAEAPVVISTVSVDHTGGSGKKHDIGHAPAKSTISISG